MDSKGKYVDTKSRDFLTIFEVNLYLHPQEKNIYVDVYYIIKNTL